MTIVQASKPNPALVFSKPSRLRFSYSKARDAQWVTDPSGLLKRDLGLNDASSGAIAGSHMKSGGQPGSAPLSAAAKGEFYFLYVLAGSAKFTQADGTTIALGQGDTLFAKPLPEGTLVYDATFEAFDCISHSLLAEVDTNLGNERNHHEGGSTQTLVVSRDRPENYVVGNGPRRFFTYRDLGATAVTDRRIHVHCIRLAEPVQKGTGWHIHSMDQFFFQVSDHQQLYVDGYENPLCTYGDLMSIPAGTKHDVDNISPTYCAVEFCIPADYDTVGTPPPGMDTQEDAAKA